MKLYFLFFCILMLSFTVNGQETNATIAPIVSLTTIVQVEQGNSYITFPTDIGNIEPLIFEGNINPNFFIRKSKSARLTGVITPQIIIRMYQDWSLPVRTPSYIPKISAYYLMSSTKSFGDLSMFAKFAHHSNGQDQDFYLPNGEINTQSGNFSTNYLEFGIIRTNYSKKFNAVQFFGTSIEIHPNDWIIDELKSIYSQYRWHTVFSIFKIPKDEGKEKNASISLKGQTTWMFGDINNWNNFDLNRLNISLTFYYHPRFFEDIGFFMQLYHGMDYYNIYFNHQISVIRFGIMTEKLRF